MSKYQKNNTNIINNTKNKNNLQENKEKHSSLYIKSLLQKLLLNSLEYPLTKLEISNSQQTNDLSLIFKNFENFDQQISSFNQNFKNQESKIEITDKTEKNDKTDKNKSIQNIIKNSVSKDNIKKTIINTNTSNNTNTNTNYKKLFNKSITTRGSLNNHPSQLTERISKNNDKEKKLDTSNINVNMNKTQIIRNSRNSTKQSMNFAQKQNNTKTNSIIKNSIVLTDYNSNDNPTLFVKKINKKQNLNNSNPLSISIDNKKNKKKKLNKTFTGTENNHNNNNTQKNNHKIENQTKIKKNLLKSNNEKNKQNKFIDTYSISNNNNTINNINNNTINNHKNYNNKSCEPPIKNSAIRKNDIIHKEKDQINNVRNIVKLVDDVNQNISQILNKGSNSHRKSIHKHPTVYNDLNSVISNLNNKILKGIKKSFQNSINENKKLNCYVSNKKNNIKLNIFSSKKVNVTPYRNDFNAKNKKNEKYKINSSKVVNEVSTTSFTSSKDLKKIINFCKIKKNKIILIEIVDNKLLNSILKYLTMKESLLFLSANKILLKERNDYLIQIKNDIIKLANLNDNESLEDKINLFQILYSKDELSKNPKNFKISNETLEFLKKLKKKNNISNFCNDFINFYRILFILLNENKIYNIINNKEFLAKCIEYYRKDNIGSFLIRKSKLFDFSPKNIYLIKKVINGNDDKLFNIHCEQNSFNECVRYLVKDILEYCGIIDDKDSDPNIMVNAISFNKMQVEKIEQIIEKYA